MLLSLVMLLAPALAADIPDDTWAAMKDRKVLLVNAEGKQIKGTLAGYSADTVTVIKPNGVVVTVPRGDVNELRAWVEEPPPAPVAPAPAAPAPATPAAAAPAPEPRTVGVVGEPAPAPTAEPAPTVVVLTPAAPPVDAPPAGAPPADPAASADPAATADGSLADPSIVNIEDPPPPEATKAEDPRAAAAKQFQEGRAAGTTAAAGQSFPAGPAAVSGVASAACLCVGCVPVTAGYWFAEPPPPMGLEAPSPDWAAGYMEGWAEESRKRRALAAFIGGTAGTIVGLAGFLALQTL